MKKNWLFPSIFGGIGIIMLVITVLLWVNEYNFKTHAEITAGTVVSLTYSSGSDGKDGTYHPVVEYKYHDQTVSFISSLGSSPPDYNEGDKVEVYFNPNKLHDAQIKSFASQWFGVTIIGSLGFVFTLIGLGIGLSIYKKSRNKEYLLANGQKIETVFQSVGLNGSYSVNGRNPYLIYSQWYDTIANKVYNFESDNIWFNPQPFIKSGKISVYINPSNPKKYYMDISFLPQDGNE